MARYWFSGLAIRTFGEPFPRVAAKRLKAARLRQARWGASRHNGSPRLRTFVLLPTRPAGGLTLCTVVGRSAALFLDMETCGWVRRNRSRLL